MANYVEPEELKKEVLASLEKGVLTPRAIEIFQRMGWLKACQEK